VLAAIDLDDEHGVEADKVENVVPERMLSSKLVVAKLPAVQGLP
jgi:hypothetical protein